MGSNLVGKSFSPVAVVGLFAFLCFFVFVFFFFLSTLIVLVPRETVLFENVWDIEI